jgi:hypothetical protein
MAIIYILILLFTLLLFYQFYSCNVLEGIDQGEIDKINAKLSELVTTVRTITNDQSIKTIKSDLDTLKNDLSIVKPQIQEFQELKPKVDEMYKVSQPYMIPDVDDIEYENETENV